MWFSGVPVALAVVVLTGTVAMEVRLHKRDLERPNRIVGGTEVAQDMFEWQVSLQKMVDSPELYKHFCGAAFVAINWVLTAAHCTMSVDAANARVVMGTYDLRKPTFMYLVEEWNRHPDYDEVTMKNDIALVKINMEKNLLPHRSHSPSHITPIPLSKEREEPSNTFFVSGFGHTSHGGQASDNLLFTQVKFVDDEECQKAISKVSIYQVFDTNLCAGGHERDACQGDSGGPLVTCREGKSMTSKDCSLSGVVSWGLGCATDGVPGIYTQTSYYNSWVKDTIDKN
ncbi:trypsin-1-like [Oratosquilla oratoria]|uniref:trypsin-1-like n=1 Tax=Oratosquilla oratoria TaxID=337810 RepID=UPI003F7574A3